MCRHRLNAREKTNKTIPALGGPQLSRWLLGQTLLSKHRGEARAQVTKCPAGHHGQRGGRNTAALWQAQHNLPGRWRAVYADTHEASEAAQSSPTGPRRTHAGRVPTAAFICAQLLPVPHRRVRTPTPQSPLYRIFLSCHLYVYHSYAASSSPGQSASVPRTPFPRAPVSLAATPLRSFLGHST